MLLFSNEIAALSRVAKNPRILTHACIMSHAFAHIFCVVCVILTLLFPKHILFDFCEMGRFRIIIIYKKYKAKKTNYRLARCVKMEYSPPTAALFSHPPLWSSFVCIVHITTPNPWSSQ